MGREVIGLLFALDQSEFKNKMLTLFFSRIVETSPIDLGQLNFSLLCYGIFSYLKDLKRGVPVAIFCSSYSARFL